MPIGLYTHPAFLNHRTGAGHPERPERLEHVLTHLDRTGRLAELDVRAPEPVPTSALLGIHPERHVQTVRAACARGGVADGGDTVVSSGSWEAALRAVGGAREAVDAVMDGSLTRAFVAARPPGHHAEASEIMGFCLFNNIALAAHHLRTDHGLERVAIVDFDVHHGNGTQHVFENDPNVLFVSMHQWPWYPGTGKETERGRGDGEGATLNCPLPSGSGDTLYRQTLESQVLPAVEDFAPQFVLISAGFDAHERDPLSGTRVSSDGFGQLTAGLVEVAERVCSGRVVSLLEGGYHLDALADSVAAHLDALA